MCYFESADEGRRSRLTNVRTNARMDEGRGREGGRGGEREADETGGGVRKKEQQSDGHVDEAR